MSFNIWCFSDGCICRAVTWKCPNGCANRYCINCELKILGKGDAGKGVVPQKCLDNECVERPPSPPSSPTYDPDAVYDGPGPPTSPSYSVLPDDDSDSIPPLDLNQT